MKIPEQKMDYYKDQHRRCREIPAISEFNSKLPGPSRDVRGRRCVSRLLCLGLPQVRSCGRGHWHCGGQEGHPKARAGAAFEVGWLALALDFHCLV